jgi:hypothetical protein
MSAAYDADGLAYRGSLAYLGLSRTASAPLALNGQALPLGESSIEWSSAFSSITQSI